MLSDTKKLIKDGQQRAYRMKLWLKKFSLDKETEEKLWNEIKSELTSAYQRGRLSQSKAFMSDIKFWDWFNMNLIYCQNTHSFVHRLFDLKNTWKNHKDAQQSAFNIIKTMERVFEAEDYEKIKAGGLNDGK